MKTKGYLLAGAALSAVLGASPAFALDTPPQSAPGATDTSAATLQEVVVTAQRRTENLQTVPIAATALNEEALAAKAVTRLADLQFASPSLSIATGSLPGVHFRKRRLSA